MSRLVAKGSKEKRDKREGMSDFLFREAGLEGSTSTLVSLSVCVAISNHAPFYNFFLF
jgi:hypothetical protein